MSFVPADEFDALTGEMLANNLALKLTAHLITTAEIRI